MVNNDDKSVQYITKADGLQYVSRHPADPQHSLHQFYSLGGFLLVIAILLIVGVLISIVSSFITSLSSQATLQVMSDPQLAGYLPAGTMELMQRTINIYSDPLYMTAFILYLAVDIALIIVIFLRKNLYLPLAIANLVVGLISGVVSVNYLYSGLPGNEILAAAAIIVSLVPSILLLVYFLTSKRVKIYFKATREELQIIR